MHDQLAVRIRHRARDLQEQAQPRRARRAPCSRSSASMARRRRTRARGTAGRRRVDAGVVEPRDVRVFERGEDLALARHALGQAGARQARCGSFSATWRLSMPSVRSASHTAPMPPRPSSRISRYGPTRRPRVASAAVAPRASSRDAELRAARRGSRSVSTCGRAREQLAQAWLERRRAPAAACRARRARSARRQVERLRRAVRLSSRPGLVRDAGCVVHRRARVNRRALRAQQQARLLPVAPHGALGDARAPARSRPRSCRRSSASRPPAPGAVELAPASRAPRARAGSRLAAGGRRIDERFGAVRQRDARGVAAAPLGLALAHEVDDDRAHHAGRVIQKSLRSSMRSGSRRRSADRTRAPGPWSRGACRATRRNRDVRACAARRRWRGRDRRMREHRRSARGG